MSTHSKTSKAILVLLAFSLTIGTVAAQPSLEIDDGDEIIWKQSPDQVVNVTMECSGSYPKTVNVQREYYEPHKAHDYKTGKYSLDMSDKDIGIYNISAECDDQTVSDTFKVDKLDLDVDGVREGQKWYVGSDESITFEFSSQVDSFENEDIGRLDISLGGENIRTKRSFNSDKDFQIDISGEKFEDILSDDEDSAEKELLIDLIYDMQGEKDHFHVEIKKDVTLNKWRVFDVNVNPDRSISSSDFSSLNFDASIWFKGEPINQVSDSFGPENFYLEGYSEDNDGSQWFDGELIDEDQGRYSLNLGPTPKTLESRMTVVFDSDESSGEIEVADIRVKDVNDYIWNAKVLTPGQDAVEANFRINYENSFVNFTSTNGDFSERIRPGEHDVDVTFPEVELSLTEVDLEEDNSGRNILYNYIFYSEIDEIQSDSNHLEGIKPVNLASFNFAYPFEDGSLDMRFNNEQIDTSESVRVYECTEWHFGDKECRATEGWEEIDDIQTIPASWKSTKYSTAEFNIEPHDSTDNGDILQNAYIVGTSADLLLNNGISVEGAGNDGRVETGGEVTVNGRIVSENDNFVEGAEVDVTFYEGSTDINSFDTVETDSEGRFSVTGEAPSEPGNYTVQIEAEAENYDDLEQRFDDSLETFIAEGIRLDVDSPLDVTLGEEVTTPVEVENTGQTEMENVELTFSGINSEFYSATDSSFSSIEAGDSRTVQLTFDFPTSYCGEVCEDYPAMDINVDAGNSEGGEFEDSDSIQTQITAVSDATSEESSEDPEETDNSGSFNAPDVAETTGEFLESQSSLNVALGLILVFLMVLAGAMKKKKEENDQRRGRNGSRPNVQRPNVQGQQNDAPDQESGDEVDDQIDEIADAFDEEESSQEEDSEDEMDEAIEEVGEAHEEADQEDQEQEEENESEDEKFECDVCGEVFDSESGRKLHKQALH